MASKPEFVEYIADQLQGAGNITWKKMFGEYGLYCDGRIFALICDNQLFLKITEAGLSMAPQCPQCPPYKGAKNYLLVEDVEDSARLTKLVEATCRQLPEPKLKQKLKQKKTL